MLDDIVQSKKALNYGVGLTTRRNRALPAIDVVPPIPERIGTGRPRILKAVFSALRGFAAHVVASIKAARFSPYTLAILDAGYPLYGTTYTVLPFSTTYNLIFPDTTNWNDTISFLDGEILINGALMPDLGIVGVPSQALPWLIPHSGTDIEVYGSALQNVTEKRVFSIERSLVHSWMAGSSDAVLNNPEARPEKALMCGASIEPGTHQAWLSQLAFTGSAWNSYGGAWQITTAHVSMLLTAPYLSKVDALLTCEQSLCVPSSTGTSTTPGHSEVFGTYDTEVGIISTGTIGSTGAYYKRVIYPATTVIEREVAVTAVGTRVQETWAGNQSATVALRGKTISVSATNSFSATRKTGSLIHYEQSFTINASPAPNYTSILCYNNGTTPWDPINYGTRGIADLVVGTLGLGGSGIDLQKNNSDLTFNVSFSGMNLVDGSASRHKTSGINANITKTTWASAIVATSFQYGSILVEADTYYNPVQPAVDLMNSVAASFVGQQAVWGGTFDLSYSGYTHLTASYATMTPIEPQALNWTTKDFMLYDELNSCYVMVDSVFAGTQAYGANGTGSLTVNLTVTTPAGTATQTLFNTTITYSDLLPVQDLDTGFYDYVPSPRLRVMFTPLFQSQGDFKGAAYTTSAEVANGAAAAYLFNFVLKLDAYSAIGEDTSGHPTIHFIPCNLLEMLYAYIYSSKYGIDPSERYPITNTTVFNNFQNTLFTNTWRVNYRNGTLVDWLDTLGTIYVDPMTTEIYRT